MEICKCETPLPREVELGHIVSCHLYDDAPLANQDDVAEEAVTTETKAE